MATPEILWSELVHVLSRLDVLEEAALAPGNQASDVFFDNNLDNRDLSLPTYANQPFRVQGAGLLKEGTFNFFNVRRGEIIVGNKFYKYDDDEGSIGDLDSTDSATDLTKFRQFQPVDADFLDDTDEAGAVDVWVQVVFEDEKWSLHGTKRTDVDTPAWPDEAAVIAMGKGTLVYPIATVYGQLKPEEDPEDDAEASINPLNIIQHHLGDIQLGGTDYQSWSFGAYKTGTDTIMINSGYLFSGRAAGAVASNGSPSGKVEVQITTDGEIIYVEYTHPGNFAIRSASSMPSSTLAILMWPLIHTSYIAAVDVPFSPAIANITHRYWPGGDIHLRGEIA